MGAEPYQITSALFGVVSQRLLRKSDKTALGGYRGRVPVAELVLMDDTTRAAVLRRDDATALNSLVAKQQGFQTLRQAAEELVAGGLTDAAEVERVLGT